jgi:exopolyphosphatase / guanosine-5'-triphosphate,3'-diphosphate pyrophosphatase
VSGRGAVLGALDCGSNSTRLLVVGPGGEPLVREVRITRLGQGVDRTRTLHPDAIARTAAVLAEYAATMRRLGVSGARLVATSAVRDAANRDEFVARASAAAGVAAEVLSGFEEARLSYAGATAGLSPSAGADVVLDIGGGSTELAVAGPHGLEAVSLDLGSVRLTERDLPSDPPTERELAAAGRDIEAELARAEAAAPALAALPAGSRLLGLAGTVSTISALEQGLASYDRRRLHHSVLSAAAVARWCDALAAEPAAARRERPGMVEGRQDVIVGGALVLRAVMARLDFPEVLVSEADILDGLIASQRAPLPD